MSDCCSTNEAEQHPKSLVIVGGGSAAFAAALRASELGARATIINNGLPIGGTCVNVGCVPSKTLIRAAEAHHRATHHHFAGIEGTSHVRDFRAIMTQKRQLVEELRQAKYLDVVAPRESIQIIPGHAELLTPNTVTVNGDPLTADRVLIATGAAPLIPPVPGLAESGYLTNDTAYELEELPESLIVLGGRYIALENAQMFARLGSRVTILQRSSRLLPTEAPDLTEVLTTYLQAEGITITTGVTLQAVRREGREVTVTATVGGEPRTFRATHLLVATGRQANTAGLGLEQVGVQTDRDGCILVDDTLQTAVPGIYAAGDVIGSPQFVYTAAYEGKLAADNALNGTPRPRDYTALPWVIFTDPQVAGVGFDEQQAEQQGFAVEVATLPLSYVPRALAARDTRGFIKLIRDRATDQLLGARILAPEGSELLMEVSLAIKYRIPTVELASLFHPYLTLGEGVKLAAIAFGKDVSQLSCCAS